MVLVYTEAPNGQFKKAAFEAITYGNKTAQALALMVQLKLLQ